jgi:hypothetical protein
MALEFVGYSGMPMSCHGDAATQAVFITDQSSWFSDAAALLRAVDEEATTLGCEKVTFRNVPNTGGSDKVELTAHFIPQLKLDWAKKDIAFHVRYESHGEEVTIDGHDMYWDNDHVQILNRRVLPAKHASVCKIVLFGVRSEIDGNRQRARVCRAD